MIGHLAIALVVQALVVAATRSWWGGAMAAAGWAMSREVTQAEYRWIEHYGHGLRANMPWWGGLDPIVSGKLDPWLDWMAPTVVVVTVAQVATWRKRVCSSERLR